MIIAKITIMIGTTIKMMRITIIMIITIITIIITIPSLIRMKN